ncbi:tRNA (5-methylaminomethyl-2-thiouridine)(34)-methyltransferase MnmD [Helicobacter cappadocius]|uniref:MnmC family methyltransferase n=1 Tax=Helicobacter cappadocius TaxID=3063998 RepID=A0AA90PS37_9HELI|nr:MULTISPECIES: MnmC family methyltransferase [unclassified Helicobacter]MDO7252587.1 MnmC family methyltransferase [Helicobacter sp. faydin-H75]MDP2538454.1 MnmC family methyltransferase [Helicobacter sp. faydin-H76]
MKVIKTSDNTFTLYNKEFNECYHSLGDGAYTETLYKHILPPIELTNLFYKSHLRILDICFGLGYNSFTTISQYLKRRYKGKLEIFSPEKDGKIFEKLALLEYPAEIENIDIFKIINELQTTKKSFPTPQISLEIFFGDAREYLDTFRTNSIDIIYQDPFSLKKNPELWDAKYFAKLFEIATDESIVTTYCTHSAVKRTAKEAGFFVYEHQSGFTRKSTLLTKKPLDKLNFIEYN